LNNSDKVAPKTADAVHKAMAQLGYIPDYVQRSKKALMTRTFGVITESIGAYFTSQMLAGINEFCHKNNYNLIFSDIHLDIQVNDGNDFIYEDLAKDQQFITNLKKSLESLVSCGAQGIIYIGSHGRNVTPLLEHFHIPCVIVNSYTEKNSGISCVNLDDEHAAHMAVSHLLDHGHEQIGIITGPTTSLVTHKRLLGYQKALLERRINLEPMYMFNGHWGYLDGGQALRYFLSLEKPPTAIFAMNDQMAARLLNEARRMKIDIPRQLSLIGFDDIELSSFTYPPLTTINIPLREMGASAAQMLSEQILHPHEQKQNLLLHCSLVSRETVASLT